MHGPIESLSWKFVLSFLLFSVIGCNNQADTNSRSDSAAKNATSRPARPRREVASEQLAAKRSELAVGLADFEYKIHREPKYTSKPKYCLFVFEDPSEQMMWLVLDGKSIYADRNGNGDLTDDGEPLKPINERTLNSSYRDGGYEPIQLASGKELVLGYFQTDEEPVKQTVKLVSDNVVQQYAGWKPIFSSTPEESKRFHFGGKYEPRPLREKQIKLSGTEEKLNVAFVVNGPGKDARTLLSIDCVPADIVPMLEIEWPTNSSNPLRSQVKLTERC